MKIILALIAVSLSGCATTSTIQDAQVQYTQACTAYGAAFSAALQLRIAGKLNKAQIAQVGILDTQITPICTGKLPTDLTAATQQITKAVTTLAIIEAVKVSK